MIQKASCLTYFKLILVWIPASLSWAWEESKCLAQTCPSFFNPRVISHTNSQMAPFLVKQKWKPNQRPAVCRGQISFCEKKNYPCSPEEICLRGRKNALKKRLSSYSYQIPQSHSPSQATALKAGVRFKATEKH